MSEVDATTKPVEAPAAEQPEKQETTTAAAGDTSVIKTTAKTDYKDIKKNNKFDPSVREVTDDPNAIRKQVREIDLFILSPCAIRASCFT
jgi:lupus La protein